LNFEYILCISFLPINIINHQFKNTLSHIFPNLEFQSKKVKAIVGSSGGN